mmetsp:Transcript_26441/g.79029  ORF Transcript_26441/g.79029 Transcript_26441/m.79029 type:complete len:202 (-) Transcript_26441:653-1258(-)
MTYSSCQGRCRTGNKHHPEGGLLVATSNRQQGSKAVPPDELPGLEGRPPRRQGGGPSRTQLPCSAQREHVRAGLAKRPRTPQQKHDREVLHRGSDHLTATEQREREGDGGDDQQPRTALLRPPAAAQRQVHQEPCHVPDNACTCQEAGGALPSEQAHGHARPEEGQHDGAGGAHQTPALEEAPGRQQPKPPARCTCGRCLS